MKRKDIGYDLYTPQEEPENDWYVIPLIVVGTIFAFVAYAGAENVFNVLAQFIGGIVSN